MDLHQHYQEKYYRPLPLDIIKSTVREILSIAEKKTGKNRKELLLLDVGSGYGEYANEFANYVKKVVGIEPYLEAYLSSVKSTKSKKVKFYNTLIEEFKTKEKFDLVVSLTTLEHMPNAEKSFKRIYGLMKKNSVLYLTAPNKLWPYENHYYLPFLSWLPLPLANIYLKISDKGNSYEDSSYSKTYFGLKSFLKKFSWDFEFYLPDTNAAYLGCGRVNFPYNLIKDIGISLIRKIPILWVISKGFIVLAHKK